jgi:hypothetical protein
VIDNFAPQPYPLEASAEPGIWMLVIGWRKDPTGQFIEPMVAWPEGGITTAADPDELRYRPADTRPVGGRPPAPAAAPTVQPARRERPTGA